MTTYTEKAILTDLADAWNAFVALPRQHPSEVEEFQRAIHSAQGIIACRVAQRADPETWPTYPHTLPTEDAK